MSGLTNSWNSSHPLWNTSSTSLATSSRRRPWPQQSPVGDQLGAGHERVVVRDEEEREGGDLLGGTEPPQRALADVLGDAVLREQLAEARVEESGCEQIDLDVVAADLAGERLREAPQRRLRGRVVRRYVHQTFGGERSDVEHVPGTRADHVPERRAGEQVGALDVDVEHRIPVRLFEQRDREDLVDPGVVDQHVQAAPGRHHVLDHLLRVRGVGDRPSEHERWRAAAGVGQAPGRLLGVGGVAVVGEGDARAGAHERQPERQPEAAGAARDQAALAGKRLGGGRQRHEACFRDGASGSERKTRSPPVRSFQTRGAVMKAASFSR